MEYYEQNADAFFANTVGVEMTSLHNLFLTRLPAGASILDAGCGSGRDARIFAGKGYRVTAFDASTELAKRATAHCGFEVPVRRFDEVTEVAMYDGIWCCASLLHVPRHDLPHQVGRLWRSLKAGGTLYASFKLGSGERISDGRTFTDLQEQELVELLRALPGVAAVECWTSDDQRPGRSEIWVNALATREMVRPARLVTGGTDPLLPYLSHAFGAADEICIAVAFTKVTGLRLLLADLQAALAIDTATGKPRCRVRVLTSDYLDVTDPEALRLLLLLQSQGAECKVYTTADGGSFHLKAYIFARLDRDGRETGTAFIGSSNISKQALQDGLEWNYRVTFPSEPGYFEARARFGELFSNPRAIPLSDAWIDDYERRRVPPPMPIESGSGEREPPPEPNAVQRLALDNLAATRDAGYRRGLVVLATGLGKTWLAAFDSVQIGSRRVLFVAHREEILSQAAETFLRIRPHSRVGFYMGQSRDAEVDILCASVQTLGKAQHLERFAAQHFDYVVVDEFHHAAATTYKRLLAHFAPAFLLGLTATPDRTDQSDILTLCDDNLVFSYDLLAGIEAGLLAPFHYYGILDSSVDYREIPWRNGRFDPEQLSNKLATLARAKHALSEWRLRAQRRTLAFCVSVRHAEYMAAHFNKAGVPSAAVYAGAGLGRAEALEGLKTGRLQVVFSVDLFNEGVDLPGIDTVMMLRPTESKILFLQQLGRGLRRAEGKDRLVVLDFIGNHESFLHKPQALFQIGATYKALAEFARRAQDQRLELPEGCFVNFDLALIEFMKALDSSGPVKDYEALRTSFGRRPTLAEFYRAGSSMQAVRQQHGSWFELVREMGDLGAVQEAGLQRHRSFLRELETTAMTKSFKMVLLEAFLELDGFVRAPTLPTLSELSWAILQRRKLLLSDLPKGQFADETGQSEAWRSYWAGNPVNAWIGGNRSSRTSTFFRMEGEHLQYAGPAEEDPHGSLSSMVQELVDYRLAAYNARRADAVGGHVRPLPIATTGPTTELPYFPDLKIACGHFRAGRTAGDENRSLPRRYGELTASRHFIARATGNSMDGSDRPVRDGDYLLLEHISGVTAHALNGSTVVAERDGATGGDAEYVLRVVAADANGGLLLKANNPSYPELPLEANVRIRARLEGVIDPLDMAVGQHFARELIPELFGEKFNPGNWNAGHIVLNDKNTHVLLVTLNKQGKADEHRYHDYWIDEETFHWQTQNSTTPSSKKGREVLDHAQRGIGIHLFVREGKLSNGKGAPFKYCGKVTYLSHSGSGPMSVKFRVGQ